MQAVAARARNVRVGDPFDEATELGPLIRPEHHERVTGYLESAVEEGARCLAGGGRPPDLPDGNFLEATVFADVTPEMRVFREEIFGPVLVATPFADEARGGPRSPTRPSTGSPHTCGRTTSRVRIASRRRSTPGSSGSTRRTSATCARRSAASSSSGIGREGGDYSFEFYCELETVHVALGEHPIPRLGLDAAED